MGRKWKLWILYQNGSASTFYLPSPLLNYSCPNSYPFVYHLNLWNNLWTMLYLWRLCLSSTEWLSIDWNQLLKVWQTINCSMEIWQFSMNIKRWNLLFTFISYIWNLRLTIFHRNSITSIIIVKFLIMDCKHCAGQLV